MNINDALNLLGLDAQSTQKEIKKAYKSQSLKFHPDRNLAGVQMMIAINAAYDFLKGLGDSVTPNHDFKANNYADELNQAINDLLALDGIILEICGNWIWCTGDTKKHSKRLGNKKNGGIGCFYARKKEAWYFRPEEYKSRGGKGIPMDDIRQKYGSQSPNSTRRAISA